MKMLAVLFTDIEATKALANVTFPLPVALMAGMFKGVKRFFN